VKFGANCGTSCRGAAGLACFFALARAFFPALRFPASRFAGLLAGFFSDLAGFVSDLEGVVRAADFFRPGWTRAFFDKVQTYPAVMRAPVIVHQGARITSKTWIGRVDVVEPGQW
jgi:hypothetical protein